MRRLTAMVDSAAQLLRQYIHTSGVDVMDEADEPTTGATTTALATAELASLHHAVCLVMLPGITSMDFPAFASILQVRIARWRQLPSPSSSLHLPVTSGRIQAPDCVWHA
jgi:hypothetical protein